MNFLSAKFLFQANIYATISLEVFTLEKRDYTFQNCQTKTFNMICVSFRSDKNYRSYKPKRKANV